jgi:hypothetical protein
MSPQPFNYAGMRPNGVDKARSGRPPQRVFDAAVASGRPHMAWMVGERWHAAVADPAVLGHDLFLSRRVRTPRRYASKRSLSGFYWFSANGDHVWHESLNESKVLRNLDHRGDIIAIGAQPATVVFPDKHWHVLDYIALNDAGQQIVIDVKLETDLAKPKVALQLTSTAAMCETVGWGYEVHVDLPVQHEQNMEWLEQFKLPRLAPPVDATDRLADVTRPGVPIPVIEAARALSPTSDKVGRTWIYHLVWCRVLQMDLTVRVGDMSPVWTAAAA